MGSVPLKTWNLWHKEIIDEKELMIRNKIQFIARGLLI